MMEERRDETQGGCHWYEEAMQYYLRRLRTGDSDVLPICARQAEFDFTPRVFDDPALTALLLLQERGAINKYDTPVLEPLVQSISSGVGVKESELETIKRLIAKYGPLPQPA